MPATGCRARALGSRALRFRETPLDEELCLRLDDQPGRDPR